MLSRNKSRRIALQILYQREVTGEPIRRILALKTYAPYLPLPPLAEVDEEEYEPMAPDAFALTLVEGVEAHLSDIDTCISQVSENWTVARMPLVDLCILRVAIYEMLYMPQTPHGAAINEAIELVKLYGGEDSWKFINGVLGKVSRNITEAEKEGELS